MEPYISHKFTMPIGTLLFIPTHKVHLIYLGIEEVDIKHQDGVTEGRPHLRMYIVEDEEEDLYPMYNFIEDLQNDKVEVLYYSTDTKS